MLDPSLFAASKRVVEITPYGPAIFFLGYVDEIQVAFLPRHGVLHGIPPHKVNYRANVWTLWRAGVRQILATAAVGGIDPGLGQGDLVVVDQCIDFTRGRPSTFADGMSSPVRHVDFTHPYCNRLRGLILQACANTGAGAVSRGCYVCAEGPRFESPAEIEMFRKLGGSVVGMTGMPEAALAKEAGLCYATLCTVTNAAAGLGHARLSHEEVVRRMEGSRGRVLEVIRETVRLASRDGQALSCSCREGAVL